MPDYLYIPLVTFFLAFIISMFMAFMIKAMLFTIRKLSKKEESSQNE